MAPHPLMKSCPPSPPSVHLSIFTRKGVAIFAKACFGHPSPSKRQKLNATAHACGCPSRPASLVLYPTRGIKLVYAMTRRDVGMLRIFTRKKRSVKTPSPIASGDYSASRLAATATLSRSTVPQNPVKALSILVVRSVYNRNYTTQSSWR